MPPVDIDRQDGHGRTELHRAAIGGDLAQVVTLLASGADPNSRDQWDAPPLNYAVSRRHNEVAEKLLAAGADPNARTRFGDSPLHLAFAIRNLALADLLISLGADIDISDKAGNTVLHLAMQDCTPSEAGPWVTWLLDHGARSDVCNLRGDTPLHYAIRQRNGFFAEQLLAAASDVNPILYEGLKRGSTDLVERLVEKGANVNYQDADGQTALYRLARDGMAEPVRTLLQQYAARHEMADKRGRTALHAAVTTQKIDCTKLLLEAGADPNQQDADGNAALHVLAKDRNISAPDADALLQLLLSSGAKIDAQNNAGDTPLHITFFDETIREAKPWAGGDGYYVYREYENEGHVYTNHDYDEYRSRSWDKHLGTLFIFYGASVEIPNRAGVTARTDAEMSGHADAFAVALAPRSPGVDTSLANTDEVRDATGSATVRRMDDLHHQMATNADGSPTARLPSWRGVMNALRRFLRIR